MPRQARIDAPGAIHHIICRGIERRRIFQDDADRDHFVYRLGSVLIKTSTPCFAWALVPNHFHLLLRTGSVSIATVMERLLTGYATEFNRIHNRHGHLFQNRYKSILCQTDPYLLELVRYIHLNPLRAHLVTTMEELRGYRYCGHYLMLGGETPEWQVTAEVLLRFDRNIEVAQGKYEAFVADGMAAGRRPELAGGGLVRSAGGWEKIMLARRYGEHLKSDERILGDSDFVEEVLGNAGDHFDDQCLCRANGVDIERLAEIVAGVLGIDVTEVWREGRKPSSLQARYLMCHWAKDIGLTPTAIGKRLKLSSSGASRAAQRGAELAVARGYSLKKLLER
jgi:putative transposase